MLLHFRECGATWPHIFEPVDALTSGPGHLFYHRLSTIFKFLFNSFHLPSRNCEHFTIGKYVYLELHRSRAFQKFNFIIKFKNLNFVNFQHLAG